MHGISGREITKYTVIYGAYLRLWPILVVCGVFKCHLCVQGCLRYTVSHAWVFASSPTNASRAVYGVRIQML